MPLVDEFDHFRQIVLHGGHRGDHGWTAESVRDQREVGEMALEGRFEDGRGTHRAVW